MNTDQLLAFVTSAKSLNYHQTARALALSEPAVIMRVHALEKELGMRLLVKAGNRLTLTENGAGFLSYAERILDLAREGRERLHQMSDPPELSIAAGSTVGTYLVSDLIPLFYSRRPTAHVTMMNSGGTKVIDAVDTGASEIGFTAIHPPRDRFTVVEEFVDQLAPVASYQHRLAGMATIPEGSLKSESFALYAPTTLTGARIRDKLLEIGDAPRIAVELDSLEGVKRVIAQHTMFSVLSCWSIVDELYSGTFELLSVPQLYFPRSMFVFHRTDRPLSDDACALLSCLKIHLADKGNRLSEAGTIGQGHRRWQRGDR